MYKYLKLLYNLYIDNRTNDFFKFISVVMNIKRNHPREYKRGIYDCSNMTIDQMYEFKKVGFEPMFVLPKGHVYIYLSDLDIYWECTGKFIRKYDGSGQFYETYEEMCNEHKFRADEFVGELYTVDDINKLFCSTKVPTDTD